MVVDALEEAVGVMRALDVAVGVGVGIEVLVTTTGLGLVNAGFFFSEIESNPKPIPTPTATVRIKAPKVIATTFTNEPAPLLFLITTRGFSWPPKLGNDGCT